jgi:hypothetical protein
MSKKKKISKLAKILAAYVVYTKQGPKDWEKEIMMNPKLSKDSDYKSGIIFFINGFLAGQRYEQTNKGIAKKKRAKDGVR